MNIKNPLNIHAIFYNEKLQLRWSDILGEFRFSLWVDKDTLRPTSLYGVGCACLYKDPAEGKPFFHTRTLKPEAKANAIVVQHVAKFAQDHGLSIKAQNEHYQTIERNLEAKNQTTIRERKEAVADELFTVLEWALRFAQGTYDIPDPGLHNPKFEEWLARGDTVLAEATGPVVYLTQQDEAGGYNSFNVSFNNGDETNTDWGGLHRGLVNARAEAKDIAGKFDAIVVEDLTSWKEGAR